MLDQSGCHPDRPEQVGGDQFLRQVVVHGAGNVVEGHEAGVVEDDVEVRKRSISSRAAPWMLSRLVTSSWIDAMPGLAAVTSSSSACGGPR
jgi:hypothetical protein